MTANLTYQLLFVLALVAVLGIVIGAALLHIKAIHSKNLQAQHHRVTTEKLRDQLAELEHRHAALERAEGAENQLLLIAKNKEDQASAQQEALQMHSRLQAQRISSLEASLLAAEERGLRMQRDFESYKMHKQQELEMSRRLLTEQRVSEQRVSEQPSNEPTDNDLPVLNKRVADVVDPPAASVQAIQAMLEQKLDIPALAESELLGSINDIDFDEIEFDEIEFDEIETEGLLIDETDPVG